VMMVTVKFNHEWQGRNTNFVAVANIILRLIIKIRLARTSAKRRGGFVFEKSPGSASVVARN